MPSRRADDGDAENHQGGAATLSQTEASSGKDNLPLLHRRSYLRMGLAAVAAVGAGAGGLTQPSRAATQRGIEFGRTIDMVEDAGCDHTGGQPIDAALDEHAGDDTLLEFPPGTYLVEREHEFEGLSNFGIVGLGDSRDEVEFVFPSGYSGIFLALWRGSDWLIENVTVQQSSDHQTGVGVVFVPYDNLQVHEFEVAGYSPWRSEGGQRAMYLDVLDPDGTAIVDGYYRTGPAHMADTDDNYSEGCQALLTDDYHEGTLYLRNCRIENASENAFYCSRGPGDVRIENCHFENNDNAAVRISTDGSYIRDSTIVVDTENAHPDNEGEFHNPRGLWVEDMSEGSSGAVAENCEFVLQSAPKIAGLLHVDASQGRFAARNCRFYDGDAKDWNHLFVWVAEPNSTAPAPADVTFDGCSFVADCAGSRPSIDLRGRSSSAIVNCCLSGTGDGILLSDATDCVVEDTTIAVEGTAIEYDNASAETANVTYDGSCPLPEPLTSGSSSDTTDGTTDDGSTSDGTTDNGSTSDGTTDDSTTSGSWTETTSTITVRSDGGGVADYTFSVDGDLSKGPEADDSDVVDGSTATGWVGPETGVDDYGLTGSVTDFTLDGPATVLVDGEVVDPTTLGESTLTIESDGGGVADYTFTVDGELTKGPDADNSDTVDGSTASGWVGPEGGVDDYQFTGAFTSFTLDGPATVLVDGQEVDPGTLGGSTSDGSTADEIELPNSVVLDGMGHSGETQYAFAVTGDVEKSASLGSIESDDTVSDGTVSGVVVGDKDGFRFSGDVQDFTIDGSALVRFEDGGTKTSTDSSAVPSTTFVDGDELAAIKAKVDAGEEPWASAYQELIADADAVVDAGLESVVDNGAPAGGDGDPHKYGTDAPYQGSDGVFSEDIDRQDYFKAIRVGDQLRNLGLAYALTGTDTYAETAVDIAYHWFVDPDTRMFPSAENYGPHTDGLLGQNSIEHYITIPKMLYGADIVRNHSHWSTKPDGAVAELGNWVSTYLAETEAGGHRGGPEGNGIYKWWLVNRAAAAAFVGDQPALERVADDWRTTAFTDYESRGTFQYALWRTRSLYYSLSALNALTLTAEILRHQGIDLYGHTVDGVSRLRTALDFHAAYLQDPSSWPWEELGGLSAAEQMYGAVSFELAYSQWQDGDYLDAVGAVDRPIYDQRILGWATLTHGNRFEL